VISRPVPERAVTDGGKKAIHPSFGMSLPLDLPGAELVALHSEHGILRLEGEARSLAVGERIRFVPYYLEGTVNLYGSAYAVRGGERGGEWAVGGRGRGR